jgi:hypothetical protein
MLASPVKGVAVSFPLALQASQVQVRCAQIISNGFFIVKQTIDPFIESDTQTKEQEFNPEFLKNMLHKIEWPALRQAAASLKPLCAQMPDLPEKIPEDAADNEDFLKTLHTALLEVRTFDLCNASVDGVVVIFCERFRAWVICVNPMNSPISPHEYCANGTLFTSSNEFSIGSAS